MNGPVVNGLISLAMKFVVLQFCLLSSYRSVFSSVTSNDPPNWKTQLRVPNIELFPRTAVGEMHNGYLYYVCCDSYILIQRDDCNERTRITKESHANQRADTIPAVSTRAHLFTRNNGGHSTFCLQRFTCTFYIDCLPTMLEKELL